MPFVEEGDQRVRFEEVMYASTGMEIWSSASLELVPFVVDEEELGDNWAKAGCESADCEIWRVQGDW